MRPSFGLDPEKPIKHYTHTVWDTTDGLPHDTVRAIVQSPDGYLWLGTQAGLARFDGAGFKVFDRRAYPEMVNDHIEALAVGLHSTLWIGTFKGLVRWSGGEMRRYDTSDGLPGDQVMALHVTGDGTLWIGTYEGGVARMRNGRIEPLRLPGASRSPIVTAFEDDGRGGVWIATFGGLGRWHEGRLSGFDPEGWLSERIWQPVVGRDGTVWVATDRGLQWIRGGSLSAGLGQREGLSNDRAISVLEDRDGQIWVGTFGAGLSRIRRADPERGTERRIDFLKSPQKGHDAIFWTLFEDRDGNVWAGALLGGLHRFSDSAFSPIEAPELEGRVISWLESPRPELAVGIEGKGLVGWPQGPGSGNPDPGSLEIYPSPATHVSAALRTSLGNLWLGDRAGGLWVQGDDDWVALLPRMGVSGCRVADLQETRLGLVWAACGKELLAWHREAGNGGTTEPIHRLRTDSSDLGNPQILFEQQRSAAQGGDRLWVGGTEGLAWIDSSATLHRFQGVDQSISAIWATASSDLWLGTPGSGLLRLRGEQLVNLHRRLGLLDDDLHSLLEDDLGNLWIGGSRGVVRVALSDLNTAADLNAAADSSAVARRLPQVLYDHRDGLRGTGWMTTGRRDREGRMWFAVGRGLAHTQPAEGLSAQPPTMVFESFEVDGEPLPTQGPIWVPAGSQTLSIRFTAPQPGGLQSVRFRHRLLGSSSEWSTLNPSSTGAPRVELTHLPAGRYAFQAQASDALGRYALPAAELSFEVEPRWTELPFVRIAAILFAGLLFYLGHLFRVGIVERSQRRLEAQVEKALAEVRVLSGMLPICSSCKSIRDDQGFWTRLESFIAESSEAQFVRSRCPECESLAFASEDPAPTTSPIDSEGLG